MFLVTQDDRDAIVGFASSVGKGLDIVEMYIQGTFEKDCNIRFEEIRTSEEVHDFKVTTKYKSDTYENIFTIEKIKVDELY